MYVYTHTHAHTHTHTATHTHSIHEGNHTYRPSLLLMQTQIFYTTVYLQSQIGEDTGTSLLLGSCQSAPASTQSAEKN